MAFKTSEKYKSVIYSGDCRHKLKLLFNGVELEDADVYCESLKVTSRIIPNGSTRFSLDNFVAKETELVLHDIDTTIIQSPVNISIGTLVDGTYEYVPIGLFVVQDLPTTDKNKTTIKLRDYAVKFDFGYNAKDIIDENGGSATKLQILQDICNKAGVETDITKFYGSNSKIGIYDNSITARTYISYLAEQAGAIATIDRSGKLIFIQLKDLETVEIPLNIVEKYEDGEKYEISRVVYEDAIRKFEYGDESKDTLFINTANPYITNDVLTNTLTGTQIETSDSADAEVVNYKQYGITKQETTEGKNLIGTNYITGVTLNDATTNDITIRNNWASTIVSNENLLKVLKPSTTYTISYKYKVLERPSEFGRYNTVYILGLYGGGSGFTNFGETQKNTIALNTWDTITKTFTTPASLTNYKMIAYDFKDANNTTVGLIEVSELQIEEGITATTFEPYTNGPSPNPDYPQEIEVGRGKNLLSEKIETIGNTYFYKDNGFKVKAGTTYTLSCDTVATGLYVRKMDGSNLFVAYSKLVLTFIPTEDTLVYFDFYYTSDKSTKYQLEKGSVATSYLPYNTIETKSTGKNLFNEEYALKTQWITNGSVLTTNAYLKSNEKILISKGYGKWGRYFFNKMKLSEGKYVLRFNLSVLETVESFACSVRDFDNAIDIVPLKGVTTIPSEYTVTFELTKPTTIGVSIQPSTETELYISNIQLEKGEVATDYQEFKESSITYNLSDNFFADKDYIENGVLNKNIGKVVLNGRENGWGKHTSSTDTLHKYWIPNAGFDNFFPNCKIGVENVLKEDSKCNLFKWGNFANAQPNTYSMYHFPNNRWLLFNTEIPTLSEFLAFLNENPMTITYPLETPEQIQLETTGELRTFEPNTIITNDLDSKMEVEYARNQTQVSQILELNKDIPLNSFKTGKIIGNPAIDAYDIIKIVDDNKEFKTLATNDLTYNGVMINTFDTQIGKEAKKENVTLTPEATFKKWAKTEIDNVEAEVRINTGKIETVVDEMGNMYTKGQVNELVANAETGVTNTFSEAGGNNEIRNSGLWFKNTGQDAETNPYEFWKGKANEGNNDKATNYRSILLGKGSFIQDDIDVPNGNYSISFYYRKLISNAVASVVINGKEYPLNSLETKQFYTGEQDNETGEYIVDPIVVSNGHIKIEFKCDALDGVELYDLMCNKGTVKLAYSQNQNETTTSTVNISKGITITSSNDENIKFKADYDGIRILDGNNNPKTTFTDKGTETDELIVRKKATITGLLHQEVDDQTWVTKI